MKLNLSQRAPVSAIIVLAIIVVALCLPQIGRVLGAFVHPDSPPPTQNSDNAQPSSVSSPSDPKEEWKLGDVTVSYYSIKEQGFHEYWLELGEDNLDIYVVEDKGGDNHALGSITYNGGKYWVQYSVVDAVLSTERNTPASDALLSAQRVIKETKSEKRWPRRLLELKKVVSEIEQGKVRLQMIADYVITSISVTDYDDDEVVSVSNNSLWKDRFISDWGSDSMVELKPNGNIVFSSDSFKAKERWEKVGPELQAQMTIGALFPEIELGQRTRLNSAYEWWSTEKYKLSPEMELSETVRYANPWRVKPKGATKKKETIGYEGLDMITIGGVNVSLCQDEAPYLSLNDGRQSYQWRAGWRGGTINKLSASDPSTVVHIRTDEDYPALKVKSKSTLLTSDFNRMQAVAKQMLTAKDSEWPDSDAGKLLYEDMKALVNGKCWITSTNGKIYYANAMQGFEGSGQYTTYCAFWSDGNTHDSLPELLIGKDGFSIYDAKSGSLLEVSNTVKLVQRPEDISVGKRFNIERARLIAAYAQSLEDKVIINLTRTIPKPAEFLASVSMPKPVSSDFPTPSWTTAAQDELFEQARHEIKNSSGE